MDQPTLPEIPLGAQAVCLQALTYRGVVAEWPWALAGAAPESCLGEREEFKTTAPILRESGRKGDSEAM